MEITKSTETIKSRCKGLFSLCFAAIDIMANEKTVSENTAVLLQTIISDDAKYQLDSSEKRIAEKFLEKPETGWVNRALWKLEELGVLLWILNLIDDTPPIWQQFSKDVLKQIKNIDNPTILRSTEEFDQYKEYLQTINWRFHFEFFQHMGRTGDRSMNDSVISKKVNDLLEKGIINEVVDGDIGFKGISFPKLSYSIKDSIKNVAETRLKVFEWIEDQHEEEMEDR